MIGCQRHFSFQVSLESFHIDCCELIDLLITVWIDNHDGIPPTLDVLFLLFGGCIFHQLKRKLSYKILSTPESQKSHLFFAFRTCFCMSVITPSCQFLADFAAHKADFSAGADKPGLENQLCYVVTAWDGTYLLPKIHFLIWKTETSRTVRKIKCFNTWKHSKQCLSGILKKL